MLATAIRTLRDPERAEELVHDVFLEIWRCCDGYAPNRGSVRTWIMLRLRSRALDELRSARARYEILTDTVRLRCIRSHAEDPCDAIERSAVRGAVAALPPAQREVLELSYFRGLSSSEIARRTGIPLGTVKSRGSAGLAKLRMIMGRRPKNMDSTELPSR